MRLVQRSRSLVRCSLPFVAPASLLVLAVLSGTGCGPGASDSLDGVQLVELQEPPLERLDPAVREQLEGLRARVRELRGADTPGGSKALGAAYADLGRRYHTYQLFEAALPCYRNAGLLLPEDPRWPYYLGHAYASLDRQPEARAAFARALELNPGDALARVAVGRTHLAEADFDEAGRLARVVLETDPSSVAALFLSAEIAVERGDYASAIEAYEKLLELQPGATRLYKALAMAYRSEGRVEEARRAMSMIGEGSLRLRDPLMRELRPQAGGAMQFRQAGIAAFKRGDLEQAVAQFRLAIEADPEYDGDRLNLGSALAQMGRYEEAAELMRAVIEMRPRHVLAHYNLGVILDRLGRREEAIETYRQALRLDESALRPRFNLATALREERRCDEALAEYARLVRDYPGDRSIRVGELLCLIQQARFEEANSRIDEALETAPDDMWLLRITARLLAASPEDAMRDGPRALGYARSIVERERSPENLETLAMALAEVGRFDEAVTVQEQALSAAETRGSGAALGRYRDNLALYREARPARDPALG